MDRDARFSSCRLYRYRLTRVWDEGLPPLAFVMLNPSRADAELDDPTMRRCIGFARDLGFGGMTALNLFAFRTPHPSALKAVSDPVGPDNDAHLAALIETHSSIVAAWGMHGAMLGRNRAFMRMARERNARLSCLGITRHGHPRHPLYVGRDKPLESYFLNI